MPTALEDCWEYLADDTVLGLGEPTHGSADALAWKFEIIQGLAERGRLAALAFEESWAVGLDVDDAFHSGRGLDEAWSRATSTWRTRTIVDGLRTLQAFASSSPPENAPRFIGVDVKRPDLAARILLDRAVSAPGLSRLAARESLSASDVGHVFSEMAQLREHDEPMIRGAATHLWRYLDAYLLEPDLEGLHRRDLHMADALVENLPDRGVTVVWAHNEHAARNPDNFGGPSMGHVLAEALGSRYVPVGLLTGTGTARAIDPSTGDPEYRSVAIPVPEPDTTDAAIARQDRSVVSCTTFSNPGPRRFFGWRIDTADLAGGDRATYEVSRPASDFEALAYLPTSTADVTWEAACPSDVT